MFEPKVENIEIIQGAEFVKTLHWYGGGKLIQEIVSLTPGCPTQIEITSHGLPSTSKTPILIDGVKGAHKANTGLKKKDAVQATYVDADNFTVEAHTRGQVYVVNTGCITWWQPKNLTGWTAELHIREKLTDVIQLVTLTSVAGDIVITIADAQIAFTIDTATTEALDFSGGVYDLELIDPAGEVTRILEGNVTLRKEVTR